MRRSAAAGGEGARCFSDESLLLKKGFFLAKRDEAKNPSREKKGRRKVRLDFGSSAPNFATETELHQKSLRPMNALLERSKYLNIPFLNKFQGQIVKEASQDSRQYLCSFQI